MHCLLLCHRSSGNGNKRLWKVGTIWIFRSCRGVRYRRTSCRSVGGRRFSAGALNSDEVSWDRFPLCGNYVYMVATIVLVVSNKPIQSSMNNTSSDSKVTMRVDGTFQRRTTQTRNVLRSALYSAWPEEGGHDFLIT